MKNILHDPVCGMDLPTNQVFLTEFVAGVTYGFCSAACANEFIGNEAKYRTPRGEGNEPFKGGAHEHFTRNPICGNTVDEGAATRCSQLLLRRRESHSFE